MKFAPVYSPCPRCEGSGLVPGIDAMGKVKCPVCAGSGKLQTAVRRYHEKKPSRKVKKVFVIDRQRSLYDVR